MFWSCFWNWSTPCWSQTPKVYVPQGFAQRLYWNWIARGRTWAPSFLIDFCAVWTHASSCLLTVLLLSSHLNFLPSFPIHWSWPHFVKGGGRDIGKIGSSAWLREERTEFACLLCVPVFVKEAADPMRGEVMYHSHIASCGVSLATFLCTGVHSLC